MLKFQRFIYNNWVVLRGSVNDMSRLRFCSNMVSINSSGDSSKSKYPPVADFYNGKSVFVTGGTGFVGKVLTEKLLYACKDIKKLYLLVREKNGSNSIDRMKTLFEDPLFTRLKNERPEFFKKVIPVNGDVSLPNLGMKPEDEEALLDKVSVVFHAAATVMFNDPLEVPMKINFEGTKKVLDLCKRMKKIEVFVYISTAYAHTQKQTLEEIVYPYPAEVSDIYKFIEKHGHDQEETMKFLDGRPSTYTLTKALTESYIAENHDNVPTIIIRPSAVGPIKDEPLKGWLDNWYGATRLLHAVGVGWNRVNWGNKTTILDLIPVDYVCNLTLIAAARCNKSQVTQVYNSCSSSVNPITLADCYRYMIKENIRSGQNKAPYPFIVHTQSEGVVKLFTVVFQMAPAYIADFCLRITGKEAKYVKIQSKVSNHREFMKFFTTHSWIMKSDKARKLNSTLSQDDKLQFPCDPADIKWDEYLQHYCRGIYKYLESKNSKH